MDLFHLAALAACLFIMARMVDHTQARLCVQCGGKGQHKDDCPLKKEGD